VPIILTTAGFTKPPPGEAQHWARDALGHYTLVANPWRSPTPTIRTAFNRVLPALAHAWRPLAVNTKAYYALLSKTFPPGRPDRPGIKQNGWRLFLSAAFAIEYFYTATTIDPTVAESRLIDWDPTLTINTGAQTLSCTFTYKAWDPPDASDLVTFFLAKPTSLRPTAQWRQTRLIGFLTTWDAAEGPYTLTGPAPWPFASGDTLHAYARHRSQRQAPSLKTFSGVAP